MNRRQILLGIASLPLMPLPKPKQDLLPQIKGKTLIVRKWDYVLCLDTDTSVTLRELYDKHRRING